MHKSHVKPFLNGHIFAGALLFTMALTAFIWANVSPESYNHIWLQEKVLNLGKHVSGGEVSYFMSISFKSIQLLINDLIMVLFFFSVSLEIKKEILAGKLSSFQKAILPVIAALGGMIFPAAIYLIIYGISGVDAIAGKGWGIPMATDIAFSLAVISLLGNRIPLGLKIFLMTLAIADDIGAIMVIAFFYTEHLDILSLLIGLSGAAFLFIANMKNVRGVWFYYLIGIAIVWTQLLNSGVHATIAGVLTGLAMPSSAGMKPSDFISKAEGILGKMKAADHKIKKGILTDDVAESYASLRKLIVKSDNPLQRVERFIAPLIAFIIMPLFALANAGVTLEGNITDMVLAPVSLGVGLGLIIGKPLGIFLTTAIFTKAKIGKLPDGVHLGQIFGIGIIAGMGFTVAMFVAELAFRTSIPEEIPVAAMFTAEAKIGILLASLLAGILGFTVLRLCKCIHLENDK